MRKLLIGLFAAALFASPAFAQQGNVASSSSSGGGVSSVNASITGGILSVTGGPITSSGTLAFTVAGTSGGIPYFSSATGWASSAALTANLPVIGGGAGTAPTVGSVSGNTTKFVTESGSVTSGNGVKADANGNLVDLTYVPAAVGTGAVLTSSPTTNATDFNQNCKQFTINGSGINIPMPSAASLGLGGCFDIVNATTNTYTITPNLTDNLNGANSAVTELGNTLVRVMSNGTADFANVPSAGGGGLTIGTTTITSGTSGRSLYDNAGVVGERVVTGTGNDVLATAPTITGGTFNGTVGSTPLFLFQPTGTTPDAFDANVLRADNCANGNIAYEIGRGDGGSARAYFTCNGDGSLQSLQIGAGGLALNGIGQITVNAMTASSAAQSGTVCYNTSGGTVTYDATLGCLSSLEELKDIHSKIGVMQALSETYRLDPFWFTWKSNTVQSKTDRAEQPGLGAHATEKVDSRLVGYGADGKLRGVRYQEMVALLVGDVKGISDFVIGLIIWNITLSFGFGFLYFRMR